VKQSTVEQTMLSGRSILPWNCRQWRHWLFRLSNVSRRLDCRKWTIIRRIRSASVLSIRPWNELAGGWSQFVRCQLACRLRTPDVNTP